MIQVLLVDDHPLITERLESRLRAETDMQIVSAAVSKGDAEQALANNRVDVVICDIRLPDGSGLELLDEARANHPAARFLMLSSFDTPQYVDAAQRLGAAGFLLKTTPTEEILASVRRIAAGGTAFDLNLVRAGAQAPWRQLTPRDRDVLAALLQGRSNDEIASDLHISRKTVEAHLSRLFARSGVLSRTELAVRAERERWLDMPPSRHR
jgi:two-component system, NarL family, response regulator DesR